MRNPHQDTIVETNLVLINPGLMGCTKRNARVVRLFGHLAVLETHIDT